MRVRNINLALDLEPGSTGRGRHNSPPVTEITCSFAGMQRPSESRSTAEVMPSDDARGDRRLACGWGKQLMLSEYQTSQLLAKDYERTCADSQGAGGSGLGQLRGRFNVQFGPGRTVFFPSRIWRSAAVRAVAFGSVPVRVFSIIPEA